MSFYTVFIHLEGKKCVLVGGGRVAERKAIGLLRAGALVIVISPELTPRLKKEKEKKRIAHIARRYKKSHLKGAFLVIAATDSYEENERVALDAGNIPVNVVDTPELCSFIVPSTVRRGPLTIAISTSGASPAMARAIRLELERFYPKSFGPYLSGLKRDRKKALAEVKDRKKRERLLKSLASPEVFRKLRRGVRPPAIKGVRPPAVKGLRAPAIK